MEETDSILDLHPGPWALDPVSGFWVLFDGRVARVGNLSPVRRRWWHPSWLNSLEFGGYRWVRSKRSGTYLHHRVVARAWHPNPEAKPQVHHIDHNPHNNHPSNLMWVTQEENMQALYDAGRGQDFTQRRRNERGAFI